MESNNLGKAVVYIGSDVSELQKGLKQATSQVSSAVRTMTIAVGALTAAFVVGIKNATNYGEEIYRLSQITGMSTESLSRLNYAAEQSDTSFEALTSGLKVLTRNIDEANHGSEAMQEKFARLGIAASDFKNLSLEQTLALVSDKFKTLQSDTERMAIATELFGRSGMNLIPILQLDSSELETLFNKSDALGNTLSGAQAMAFKEFGDNLKDLRIGLRGIWISIANDVIPQLNKFLEALQKTSLLKDLAVTLKDVVKTFNELPASLKVIIAAFAALSTGLGRTIALFGLFPDTIRVVTFFISQIDEAFTKVDRAVVKAGISMQEFLHMDATELKNELSGIEEHLRAINYAQQEITAKPLNVENIFNDISALENKLNAPPVPATSPVQLEPISITHVQSAFDNIKSIMTSFKGSWQGWTEELKTGWHGLVTNIESGLGKAFSTMILEGGKFKDVMANFWQELTRFVIECITQMIAEWLVFTALEAAAGFLGFHKGGEVMHKGGLIPVAHDGLAVDERVIIAQTGEGILSRKGMAALGGADILDMLNQGGPVGGNVYNTINVSLEGAIISNELDVDDLSNKLGANVKRALRSI